MSTEAEFDLGSPRLGKKRSQVGGVMAPELSAPAGETTRREDAGFSRFDLLAVIPIVGLLAILPFTASGNAKGKVRQVSCMNNLRQLGVATRLYVMDYGVYPGCYSPVRNVYVWPERLMKVSGLTRSTFCCPSAPPNAWWDSNYNNTLGAAQTITPTTRFSLGYNDWGVSISAYPQLGLGGDVDGAFARGLVTEATVVNPANMMLIADTAAVQNPASIGWGANLDPTARSQWPANRHAFRTDILFCDGRVQACWRRDVVDPASLVWRSRWNNDSKPHNEVNWAGENADATLDQ